MRTPPRLALAVLTLLLAVSPGCVLSLAPVWDEASLVSNVPLAGTWTDGEGEIRWTVTAEEGSWSVTNGDESGRTAEFRARVFRVGKERFLDLEPKALPGTLNPFYADHWIAAHTVAHLRKLDDASMELAVLDEAWLKGLVKKSPKAIALQIVGGDVVFTATPAELRRFFAKHVSTTGAYRAPLRLRRVD